MVGKVATYKGESSRSSRQRSKEHSSALQQGLTLATHAVQAHGGFHPKFLVVVDEIEARPMYRAIKEAIAICNQGGGSNNLNRCGGVGARRKNPYPQSDWG